MKKFGVLLSLILVGFLVKPAFAFFNFNWDGMTIENSAMVETQTQTGAFTGSNEQWSGFKIKSAEADDVDNTSSNALVTGAALATSTSRLLVNSTFGCGCEESAESDFDWVKKTNEAMVMTGIMTQADSGSNTQKSGTTVKYAEVDDVTTSGSNSLTTGDATATSRSLALVNVSWSGMFMPE